MFEVFDWLEMTWIGQTIRESLWLFPVIEAVHLLALAVLGGAVLIVDLRLLGVGIQTSTPAEVARRAQPILILGIVGLLSTGIPLFLSEAIKCYYNQSFWVKMIGLSLILLFTFTWRKRYLSSATSLTVENLGKMTAAVSMGMWFLVAAAGRWIGFS